MLLNTLEHPSRLFWWVAVDFKVGQGILVHFLPSVPAREGAMLGESLPLLRLEPTQVSLSRCMMAADGG